MPTLPPIANLQAFEAVARRRSFALAAAELNLTRRPSATRFPGWRPNWTFACSSAVPTGCA